MAAATQLLAWSLVLVLVLLPASPLPQPFSSERHSRPGAAGASLGPGWVQELAGWLPLGSPSKEPLWTHQDLPALSPLALAAPGGSLVFSGAGEPDDELWRGSNPAHSAAIGHDTGTPPAPAGSSALPPPTWPLLLGSDDSQQTLEVAPAPGSAGTEGSENRSPGALAFESRERPLGSEPRSLHPAFPSLARPPGAESSPSPAGQDSLGTAGTPCPRPTVSTVALAARLDSTAGASSAEGWQAADTDPGSMGQGGQPVSWAPGKGQPAPQASVPQEPREPLEHAWEKGRASHTQGYSLPPWGNAQGLPPHPIGRDGQPQLEAWWVPGASLAARPATTSQPQQTPGAGDSMAGRWPGLPPVVLSTGHLELGDGAWELPPSLAPVQGRLAEPAPPAHGSPTWRLTPARTETRAPAWTEGLSAHQRSTRRALPGSVTQPPHIPGKAAPGVEQGPEHPRTRPTLHTSLGTSPVPTPPRPGAAAEEEIGAPQRVRGAVDPRTPVNATSTATSAPRPPLPGIQHSDETRPPGHGSTTVPVPTQPQSPATPHRGLIRVSTQRALQRPSLPEPGPSVPATVPASSLPCPHASGACSLLQPNQTLLRWADLQHMLGFAWELHVYGASALFLLLSLVCVASLIGSPVLDLPHLPYTLGANALLLGAGLLRATFLLSDPYGTRARLPAPAVRLLYNAPFPLLLSAFALLLLLLLRVAQLQLLPPPLQSLPLLAVLAVLQSTVLLGADLLSPLLSPMLGVGLHLLSCACGTSLMLANLAAYWQLRAHQAARPGEAQQVSLGREDPQELPEQGRALQVLGPCPRVLLGCSALGLLCCGLQAYGVLWLGAVLGPLGEFSWPWWFVQFWFRICELLLAFGLCFVASHPFCQCCGAADHICWAKLIRYFCTYHKAEAPEYPNNCYDWANGMQERAASTDISRSLIRNPPEQLHLRALKDSNEGRVPGAFSAGGSTSSLGWPGVSPKCPNAARVRRSYTSICFEKESVLSLGELEFRPPSPINLSRSIDEALFKEHLVRDSIFLRSSLQCPGRLARQDSCSSLRRGSALMPMAEPLLPAKAWQRRSSDPDYLYSLARCSSLSDLPSQSASLPPSKGLPSEPPTEGTISGSSLDSFSKGSLKISWNPWRHGLSSLESLPLGEMPSQAPLLTEESPGPSTTGGATDSECEARRSFLALSKQVDSRSMSSDTIEL
nr:proline-rich transmembrane protein 3 [Chelonoidis abingdonii]